MLTIRLSRIGKRKQPTYRIIVIEKHRDPWAKYLELLGNYNPRSKQLEVKIDRVKYWVSKGAELSASVNNLLIKTGQLEGKKMKVVKITSQRQEKITAQKKAATPAEPTPEKPEIPEAPETVKAEAESVKE